MGSSALPKPPPVPQDAEGMKSTRSYFAKTQEEMWSEFNHHFRNPNRPAVKVNHHDFLDGSFLTKLKEQQSRRTFFSQVGTQSLDRGARPGATPYEDFKEADIELGRHRLKRAKDNYKSMQKQSYEIPLNKEKAGIPRWLQQKLKQEGKSLAPRVYQAAKEKQIKQQSQAQLELQK